MSYQPAPYPIPEQCPYCNSEVLFTSNRVVYGKEFGNGKCYTCTSCDAYVGVHNGTTIPLGILANKELRTLKKKAHGLFDPIWQSGKKKRKQAYEDLAKQLGIPTETCHFGWFGKERLIQAIGILEASSSAQIPDNAHELVEEAFRLLQQNSQLTDEWGHAFITSLKSRIDKGGKLTDKQIACLVRQHDAILINRIK